MKPHEYLLAKRDSGKMTGRLLVDAAGKTITMVEVDGYLIPTIPSADIGKGTPEETKELFDYIPHFKCRDDDVMLMSYPKTGTNWLYEVLVMLLNKSPERVQSNKLQTMLEFTKQDIADTLPSPRVINTHVKLRFLPKELKEKKLRTVLVVRNPKDTLVSYYNHIKGFRHYGYDGQWNDWFQLYMQGEMEYGMYTDYLKEIETAIERDIGFPFHVIHYEDLKLNGLEELQKLAKFLDVEEDKDVFKKILEKCSFESMVKEHKFPEKVREKAFNQGFNFFRKGQVGDWQNWFTVAQNEQFDAYWKKEMADSKLKFTYTQPASS